MKWISWLLVSLFGFMGIGSLAAAAQQAVFVRPGPRPAYFYRAPAVQRIRWERRQERREFRRRQAWRNYREERRERWLRHERWEDRHGLR